MRAAGRKTETPAQIGTGNEKCPNRMVRAFQ